MVARVSHNQAHHPDLLRQSVSILGLLDDVDQVGIGAGHLVQEPGGVLLILLHQDDTDDHNCQE